MSGQKKATAPPAISQEEVQQNYTRLQTDMQSIAGKIGELEQEVEEHALVLATLNEALGKDPDRKCFRLIGGVLAERTVKDVVPQLQSNCDNIKKVVGSLAEQYKTKESEFDKFKTDYNIRAVRA